MWWCGGVCVGGWGVWVVWVGAYVCAYECRKDAMNMRGGGVSMQIRSVQEEERERVREEER